MRSSRDTYLLAPVSCPAKLNLDLRVGPVRADGFHPIRSWFVTVGLYDTIEFTPADELSLTCDDPSIPTDARNLVWRAAEALQPAGRGVAMHLTKVIPAGGGLGGGSSDAAGTLVALNDFWELGHAVNHLHAIAATLGSDVPFFLHGPSSVCTGRGDIVTPVPPPACRWAVLLLPGIKMVTPTVFRRLDAMRQGDGVTSKAVTESMDAPHVGTDAADARTLLGRLGNDLERAAFDMSPALSDLRAAAEWAFLRPVRMSGSGSTLFTLFDGQSEASVAAMEAKLPDSVRVVVAPVAVI